LPSTIYDETTGKWILFCSGPLGNNDFPCSLNTFMFKQRRKQWKQRDRPTPWRGIQITRKLCCRKFRGEFTMRFPPFSLKTVSDNTSHSHAFWSSWKVLWKSLTHEMPWKSSSEVPSALQMSHGGAQLLPQSCMYILFHICKTSE
jgi:hypothetical protein